MTCIVGLVHKGTVTIGADSAGVAGLHLMMRRDPKVFRVGEAVIGATGSFRALQLLRFSLELPKLLPDEDLEAWMVRSFVPALRRCWKDGGYMRVENNAEEGGTFLIGIRGRLFRIEDDLQVGERLATFDAVGCGAPYAIGALAVLADGSGSPQTSVRRALEVAEANSAGVRGPFAIESTTLERGSKSA